MTRLALLLSALVAAAAVPGVAVANSSPLPLDQVASRIAGHPVSVDCVTSYDAWVQLEQQQGGGEAEGFTVIGRPVIYVAPVSCWVLTFLERGQPVGAWLASYAILTLAHESVHQQGVTSEAAADCAALSLVRQVALELGYPATVRQGYTVRRRRHGRLVRLRRYRQVPNPQLDDLQADALLWHQSKPAEYQGGC